MLKWLVSNSVWDNQPALTATTLANDKEGDTHGIAKIKSSEYFGMGKLAKI